MFNNFKFFGIVLISSILFSCSLFVDRKEELSIFLENYLGTQCQIAKIGQKFVASWPSVKVGEVPELGETPLAAREAVNLFEIQNISGNIDRIKKSPLSSDFSESIRLLELQNQYMFQMVEKTTHTKDYYEFYDIIIPMSKSYGEVYNKMQTSLMNEYLESRKLKDITVNIEDITMKVCN